MITHYNCTICGNDWMTTLPIIRHKFLCQVCDHMIYGNGPEVIEITSELNEYLVTHGYVKVIPYMNVMRKLKQFVNRQR